MGEFADAIDQLRHFLTEQFGNLLLGGGGVFDHIMQQRSDQALGVHAHFRQDVCHGQGMIDVGFATGTRLSVVGLGAK